jgi:hypothetical protein
MLRAAQLDAALYEEVEADHGALWQATSVVVLSSLAAGIGSRGSSASESLIIMILATLLGWYIWAYLTYFIGTRVLPGLRTEADWGQLLRTIGFSSAPGVLRVIGVFFEPAWIDVIFLVVAAWMLVAMVIAVRQALDYESTTRAVAVCLVGWIVNLVIVSVLLEFLSPSDDSTPAPALAGLALGLWVG